MLALIFFSYLLFCVQGYVKRSEPSSKVYQGHEVVSTIPVSKVQLELLNKLQESGEVDFWSSGFRINRSVVIHLTKENQVDIGRTLKNAGMDYNVTVSDIDAAMEQCRKSGTGQEAKDLSDFSYTQFNEYPAIVSELRSLEERYPKEASPFSIGSTFEDKQIPAIKISIDDEDRKLIVIDCGTHAREWISPATCLYIIRQLLFREYRDSDTTRLLQKFNFVLVPVMNPDGYTYTFKDRTTRLWRKNRSRTKEQVDLMKKKGKEICLGVDINRNFGFKWGGLGATSNPCSVIFQGPRAFSEKESSSLAKYIKKHRDDIAAHISLHSFSQVWMPPWGFKEKKPKDYDEQMRVAKIAVAALKKYRNTDYEVGNSHDLMYPNSGSSTDWAYGAAGIKYAYTVEMVDKGLRNFLQPESEIEPNGREIFDGIKAMAFALDTDDL